MLNVPDLLNAVVHAAVLEFPEPESATALHPATAFPFEVKAT